MKAFVFVLLCIVTLPLSAQCVIGPGASWPTQVTLVPVDAVEGQPVSVVLGPPESLIILDPQVSVAGSTVTLTARVDQLAILPPPPSLVTLSLGVLPPGAYTVRVVLTSDLFACTPFEAPLGVAAASVPAAGTTALGLLLLAVGTIGAARLLSRR